VPLGKGDAGVAVRIRAVAVGLGALLLVAPIAGCGSDAPDPGSPDSTAVVLRPATLRPGQAVPAPTGPTLLTLTGKVTGANRGSGIALDRATLARLTQVELHTYEPWVKQDLSFRGVWLDDVLALAGATAPSEVQIQALDDYIVRLSAADLRGGGILLATADGAGHALPIPSGGPTRIVFAPGIAAGANADQWIWSLRTIDVR
jgi:hypothetical protein